MRKITFSVVLAATGLFQGGNALASDYGCQVLLCLANPAGPTAVAQCVPPISQLWRDLARVPPRPFPTCDEARPAVAVQNTTWYDPCPEGTTELAAGTLALLQSAPTATPYVGIGSGDSLQPSQDTTLGQKVCVGNQTGQTTVVTGSGESMSFSQANLYDHIALLDPATSPRVIDVYLNNALYRRVRW